MGCFFTLFFSCGQQKKHINMRPVFHTKPLESLPCTALVHSHFINLMIIILLISKGKKQSRILGLEK